MPCKQVRCSVRLSSVFIGFCVLLLLGAGICWAQVSTTGKIAGTVYDSSGAGVPNATVEVKGPALMVSRTTHTQADGSYLFDVLPPGTYTIIVAAGGFRTLQQPNIVISAGFTARVSSKLQVGQVQEVMVIQDQPVVDVQSVQAETTFDQQLLQDIPAGRDPWSM